MKQKWTVDEERVLIEMANAGVPLHDVAKELGRTHGSITNKMQSLGLEHGIKRERKAGFTIQPPPSSSRSIAEVMEAQAENFRRKQSHHEVKAKGIEVTLDDPGPFAIAFFGDPHVDDDGCDLEYLAYCMGIVNNTPHMYGANIGDLSNNWIGRLGRLYGVQHVTEDEAVECVDWLVQALPWMFVILGNHDKWGILAELKCKEHGVVYVSHGAIFNIICGESRIVVDARHDMPGRSQYLANFAQVKKNWRGSQADIIVAGHIHTSATAVVKNGVADKLAHCIRVGAFKRYDDYADRLGFADDSVSPIMICVVDPRLKEEDPDRIKTFMQPERAADYLGFLRGQYEK